ncbi:MAG: hypothetical protein [Caudoviricetes sp.]|jgi:hypothetical protein|nr:MAG: hypothetical protein [Caudoviricetes sp.]
MSFSKPKIPAATTPAARPERSDDVAQDQVTLGDSDSDTMSRGKRALLRPSGVGSSTASGTGTGLAV